MINYIWPMVLIVASNTVYQICAKEVPGQVSPFASLTITYLVGALCTAILHFILRPNENILKQFTQLNWAPFALGLVIVGLEVGWIFAYKAGWQVNTGFIMQSAILAILLIFVGALLYHESVSWNKLVGIAACFVGLVFINLK